MQKHNIRTDLKPLKRTGRCKVFLYFDRRAAVTIKDKKLHLWAVKCSRTLLDTSSLIASLYISLEFSTNVVENLLRSINNCKQIFRSDVFWHGKVMETIAWLNCCLIFSTTELLFHQIEQTASLWLISAFQISFSFQLHIRSYHALHEIFFVLPMFFAL